MLFFVACDQTDTDNVEVSNTIESVSVDINYNTVNIAARTLDNEELPDNVTIFINGKEVNGAFHSGITDDFVDKADSLLYHFVRFYTLSGAELPENTQLGVSIIVDRKKETLQDAFIQIGYPHENDRGYRGASYGLVSDKVSELIYDYANFNFSLEYSGEGIRRSLDENLENGEALFPEELEEFSLIIKGERDDES
ncbi:MAG: hypothetical protein GDA51_00385 [Ekhidna sp.]|nr:hypothetical protein [Ekhidna sp.]MBC6424939.1 hypothetical protein [Ekhidna sp.]